MKFNREKFLNYYFPLSNLSVNGMNYGICCRTIRRIMRVPLPHGWLIGLVRETFMNNNSTERVDSLPYY